MVLIRSRRAISTFASHMHHRDVFNRYAIQSLEERSATLQSLFSSPAASKESLHHLNQHTGGIALGMKMKEDLSIVRSGQSGQSKEVQSALRSAEDELKGWLSTVFNFDSLELKRITFESASGIVLEKVAHGEAVHRVRSLAELKRRMHDGRRCFGLFHKSLPEEPLAFLHVAFTPDLAPSLRYLNTSSIEYQPSHAIFYSVNSPLPALSGLDLASRIIKLTTASLQAEIPSIHTFSTLSPIPGFMAWLKKSTSTPSSLELLRAQMPQQVLRELDSLRGQSAPPASSTAAAAAAAVAERDSVSCLVNLFTEQKSFSLMESPGVKAAVQWLGAHYLSSEKLTSSGLPLDSVARFHLRNGAALFQLNWMANTNTAALASSAGLMVNYMYHTTHHTHLHQAPPLVLDLDARALRFEESKGDIIVGNQVNAILGNLK